MNRSHPLFYVFNPMALGLFLIAAPFLQAAYVDDWGPAIGASLPSLNVKDTEGQDKALQDLSGENGLLLMVTRSTYWDGVCKKQLEDVNGRLGEIESMSVGVAAISYDKVEQNQMFHDSRALGYPLLSDVEYQSVKALGIFDRGIPERHFAYGVSRPGVLFVDPDGVVVLKWAIADPDVRPALDEVLPAIREHLGIEE